MARTGCSSTCDSPQSTTTIRTLRSRRSSKQVILSCGSISTLSMSWGRVLSLGVRDGGRGRDHRHRPVRPARCRGPKIAARKLTSAYEESGSLPQLDAFFDSDGFRLIADERNACELRNTVEEQSLKGYLAAQLSRVQPGDYVALLAYLPMSAEHEWLLSEIRVLIRDRLRVATCVGFGPRFQHSTGQAYKGGPNSGVFLQITCEDSVELAVPGHKYTFATVKEAQARGDFDTLAKHDRRALRIDVGAEATEGLRALRDAIERVLP